MVVSFCRELRWQEMVSLLKSYEPRMNFGVKPELVPVMRIPSLRALPFKARLLFKKGYETVEQLASVSEADLVEILQSSVPFELKCSEDMKLYLAGENAGGGGASRAVVAAAVQPSKDDPKFSAGELRAQLRMGQEARLARRIRLEARQLCAADARRLAQQHTVPAQQWDSPR
jgi:hypothetical protein